MACFRKFGLQWAKKEEALLHARKGPRLVKIKVCLTANQPEVDSPLCSIHTRRGQGQASPVGNHVCKEEWPRETGPWHTLLTQAHQVPEHRTRSTVGCGLNTLLPSHSTSPPCPKQTNCCLLRGTSQPTSPQQAQGKTSGRFEGQQR